MFQKKNQFYICKTTSVQQKIKSMRSMLSCLLFLLPLSLPFTLVSLGCDKASGFYVSQFPGYIL